MVAINEYFNRYINKYYKHCNVSRKPRTDIFHTIAKVYNENVNN